jgi:hypothetical protein
MQSLYQIFQPCPLCTLLRQERVFLDHVLHYPGMQSGGKLTWYAMRNFLQLHGILQPDATIRSLPDDRAVSYICSETGLSRQKVNEYLNWLDQEGFIKRRSNANNIMILNEQTLHSITFEQQGNPLSCVKCGKPIEQGILYEEYVCSHSRCRASRKIILERIFFS